MLNKQILPTGSGCTVCDEQKTAHTGANAQSTYKHASRERNINSIHRELICACERIDQAF